MFGHRMHGDKLSGLTRDEILQGLEKVNAYLAGKNVQGEICIYDEACLCLAFAGRVSTKDVDAVFEPAAIIRKAAFEVAHEMGWNWNWLNDDVKGFVSETGESAKNVMTLPEFSNLKVYTAAPEYLLAMKCLAAREGDEEEPSTDLADTAMLCRELKISTSDEIERVISKFYRDTDIPERTGFFIAEVLNQLNKA